MKVLQRAFPVLLESLAAIVAGVAILAGILVWWLSSGPVALSWLTPHIEQALARDEQFRIQIEDTRLTWEGWERLLEVQAKGVQIATAEGSVIARLPQVRIGLAAPALLHSMVAPKSIEVIEPEIRVVRTEQGDLEFVKGDTDAIGQGDSGKAILRLAAHLLGPPDPTQPHGYLSEVKISGARLSFEDRKAGRALQSPRADMVVERNDAGLRARFNLPFDLQGSQGSVSGTLIYRLYEQTVDFTAQFDSVRPADFAPGTKALAAFADFQLPVSGSVSATMPTPGLLLALGIDPLRPTAGDDDPTGLLSRPMFETGRFDLKGGAGALTVPTVYSRPLHVEALHLRGRWGNYGDVIEIDRLFADLGGPSIHSTGRVETDQTAVKFNVKALVRDVALAELQDYWPDGVSRERLTWVQENLKAGRIDETKFVLTGYGPRDRLEDMTLKDVSAEMSFTGVSLSLIPNMAPVNNLTGTAVLSDNQVDVTIDDMDMTFNEGWPRVVDFKGQLALASDGTGSGTFTDATLKLDPNGVPVTGMRGKLSFDKQAIEVKIAAAALGKMAVSDARVEVTEVESPAPKLDARFVAKGQLADMLRVLETPPFDQGEGLGLDPDQVEGKVAARMALRSVVGQGMDFDKIERAATARLIDVTIHETPFGLTVAGGDFHLDYDPVELRVWGEAEVNGVQAGIDWTETLSGPTEYRSRFILQGVPDEEGRARIGFDLGDNVTGPTPMYAEFIDYDRNRQVMHLDLDLKDALVDLPELYWSKAAGIAGKGRLTISFEANQAKTIDSFHFEAADFVARGQARLGGPPKKREVLKADFDQLAWGPDGRRNDVQGSLRRRTDGGWDVALFGPTFDASSYLGDGDMNLEYPMTLTTRFDHVWLADDRVLKQTSAAASYDGAKWDSVEMTAYVPDADGEGGDLVLRLRPADAHSRTLFVKSSRAGAALQMLSDAPIFRAVSGGELLVTGTIDDADPEQPVHAGMQITNFRLVEDPAIQGLVDALREANLGEDFNNGGIPFDIMQARFSRTERYLKINQMRARGQAVGLTAQGEVDFTLEEIDLRGLLAPIEWQEALLASEPRLGIFVDSSEGHDHLALGFSVYGGLVDPGFEPIPLSGFDADYFRIIFGVSPAEAGLPETEDKVRVRQKEREMIAR